jgi:hypothetical protein
MQARVGSGLKSNGRPKPPPHLLNFLIHALVVGVYLVSSSIRRLGLNSRIILHDFYVRTQTQDLAYSFSYTSEYAVFRAQPCDNQESHVALISRICLIPRQPVRITSGIRVHLRAWRSACEKRHIDPRRCPPSPGFKTQSSAQTFPARREPYQRPRILLSVTRR